MGAGTGDASAGEYAGVRRNGDDIPALYQLLKPSGLSRWSLFFLISVGRGKVLEPLSPEAGEKLIWRGRYESGRHRRS